jgi:dipeptidyl aminopeptidase/acylaminoacyl peptidase
MSPLPAPTPDETAPAWSMPRDIRQTAEHQLVQEFYTRQFAPGANHVCAIRDIQTDKDGHSIFLTGLSFRETLAVDAEASIYRFDRHSGILDLVRRDGRLARPSPTDKLLAIVGAEDIELLLTSTGATRSRCRVDGVVEQLRWSPDGGSLAMLVAGSAADVSGAEGGYALSSGSEPEESWIPTLDSGDSEDVWRRVWLWRLGDDAPEPITAPPVNVWEFDWAGPDALAVIASDHHGEGSWYSATLRLVELSSRAPRELFQSADQIGLPAASADGSAIAFVEAVCSDRGIMCGTLRLLRQGHADIIDTKGTEVSDIRWAGPDRLAYAGIRGHETVVGEIHLDTNEVHETWVSTDLTCGEWYPSVVPCPHGGLLMAVEGYAHPPALATIEDDALRILLSFAASDAATHAGRIEPVSWTAPDGLEIQGWLVRDPARSGPTPLLVDIHGGPIWTYRNRWVARLRAAGPLVDQGWSVFLPNPRGAAGRGQDFARHVIGDMGGADTLDIVSGIEHLVAKGLADRSRLAVTGTSYGGFMSAWLVTQHHLFAAAVPISPVSNWFSQHYTSQIPSFDAFCLDGSPRAPGGQYFERSPVFFAQGVSTPTLILAGGRDKNTPPTQALEFHHALLEGGCEATLCTYPEHGHSLRGHPAYLDSAARTMIWLNRHVRGE